ncbi:MAG: hypothetical protein AB7J28_02375 [Hyphomonadaceae bacterium]
MSTRQFEVGERVRYAPSRRNPAKIADMEFVILKALPDTAPRALYRIKSETEACERVAAASQLESIG